MSRNSDLSLALVDGDWNRATSIARGVPAQAAMWTHRVGFFEGVKNAHCLPLHEACMTTAPLQTVEAIVMAYRDAVRTAESSYSRLPLHCACRRAKADPAIIKLLLQFHKAACLVPDDLGRLPLHYALSNGADSAVIHLLLTAGPAACKAQDNAGWTPLHVACAAGCKVGIFMALLHEYPEASVLRTDKGSPPIKCLAKSAASDRDEIKEMLKSAQREFDRTFVNPLKRNRSQEALYDAVYV